MHAQGDFILAGSRPGCGRAWYAGMEGPLCARTRSGCVVRGGSRHGDGRRLRSSSCRPRAVPSGLVPGRAARDHRGRRQPGPDTAGSVAVRKRSYWWRPATAIDKRAKALPMKAEEPSHALLQHHRPRQARQALLHPAAGAFRPGRGPSAGRRREVLRAARPPPDGQDLLPAGALRPAERAGLRLRVHHRRDRAQRPATTWSR